MSNIYNLVTDYHRQYFKRSLVFVEVIGQCNSFTMKTPSCDSVQMCLEGAMSQQASGYACKSLPVPLRLPFICQSSYLLLECSCGGCWLGRYEPEPQPHPLPPPFDILFWFWTSTQNTYIPNLGLLLLYWRYKRPEEH